MKKILFALLMSVCGFAQAQTFPVQNLQVNGTSNFVGAATFQTGLALTNLASQAANTIVANSGASAGVPTAIAVPNCVGPSSALNWTSGGGFSCNSVVSSAATIDVKNTYGGNVVNAVAAANAAPAANLYFAGNTIYTVSGASTLGPNVNVLCDPGAVIQTTSPTADIFDQNGSNTVNNGCTYSTTVLRTGGDYIKLIGSQTHVTNFAMNNAYNGIEIAGTTAYIDHGFINSSVSNSVLCSQAGDAHVSSITSNNQFGFTGYISGTTLTVVTAAPYNNLAVGQVITGSTTSGGTAITALGTGGGGIGTYTVNNSQTVGSSGSPVALISSGSGTGVAVTGNLGGAGCALTLSDSGILKGGNSVAVTPSVSGATGFLLVTNSYLDNASTNGALFSTGSVGAIGFAKIIGSEIGTNGPSANGVTVSIPSGGSSGSIVISGNTIYNYTPSTGTGVLFTNSVAPLQTEVSHNIIGSPSTLFNAGISINYAGNSNVIASGNFLQATTISFFIGNTADTSCIISNNRLVTSGHTSTGCNQNNNY